MANDDLCPLRCQWEPTQIRAPTDETEKDMGVGLVVVMMMGEGAVKHKVVKPVLLLRQKRALKPRSGFKTNSSHVIRAVKQLIIL